MYNIYALVVSCTCIFIIYLIVIFSSAGASSSATATIVGESTVPKKSGVIATQAGSTKIMHPEEDLSLV